MLPDGTRTTREVVECPGSAAMVPVPEPGKVILIRQYRYSVDNVLWEIPAGTLEPGESPRSGALRELREEIGYTARKLRLMADLYTSPGILTERMRLYLATDLRPSRLAPDRDEQIEPRVFPFSRVTQLMANGRIRDGKTLLGLSLLAQTRPDLTRG